ncbi:MAG: CHAT domain-containing protein [Lewinellaceae bacterium]|nr:CHAT domain-containing protein [Lewinellaceae bacterium]
MRTSLLWLILIAIAVFFCGQSPNENQRTKAPKPFTEAMAMVEKAQAFLEKDALDSTLVYARRAVSLSEEGQNWYAWGKAQAAIIITAYYQDECQEVAATFSDLEKTARVHLAPDSSFWGDYYNLAGAVYNELGNYEAALEFGLREIAFFEKTENHAALGIACNNVGTYYRSKGDFDRSLEYTLAALQHFSSDPKTTAQDISWTYSNLCGTQYRRKVYPSAIEYGLKSLQILQKSIPESAAASDYIVIYNDLANINTELEQYELALDYLKKALNLHQTGHARQEETTLHNIGYVYRMMGRYPEANNYLKQAIDRYGPKHPNYAKACRHLGYIAHHQGRLDSALIWQQKALLALTDTFPYEDVLVNPAPQRVNAYLDFLFTLRDKGETLRQLAAQENKQHYAEAALATYDLAASLLDSMRMEYQEGSRQFWNGEARPIMEKAIDLAMELYRKTQNQTYLGQAFRYAERSKALLLAEALRESAAKQQAGIPEALLKEEKQLKIDIAFYKTRIFREQQRKTPDNDKILLWQTQILHCNRDYDALRAKLEEAYPEYYQIKYEQPEYTIAAIQKKLPRQTGLLEFFSGDRGIYAFYIDPNTAKGYMFRPDSSFDNALEALLLTLRDRGRAMEEGRSAAAIARYSTHATALFRALLAPVGQTLPKKLLLIPDGKLAYLPFELLLTEDAGAAEKPSYAALPYLLRQSIVRYEYSAALALNPPVRRKVKQLFAGFAPGYSGDWTALDARGALQENCAEANPADFAPLQNNKMEVSQIAQQVEGRAFLGDAATEAQFRNVAAEPRIVHLAMHGFLNDCDPLYSGLVFSNNLPKVEQDATSTENDGILYAYEIYNLRLNAELAVLSACNTGSGKLAKGEGVISLARAFKYAGCANVLMSLWQADDQATAQIMRDFYRYLRVDGMDKDAAIRLAKLDYLDNNSRNHPFFWGAFVLIGDDQPMHRGIHWLWYLAGLCLLGLGGWYFLKKRKSSLA